MSQSTGQHCSAKPKGSICLLVKRADTALWPCTAEQPWHICWGHTSPHSIKSLPSCICWHSYEPVLGQCLSPDRMQKMCIMVITDGTWVNKIENLLSWCFTNISAHKHIYIKSDTQDEIVAWDLSHETSCVLNLKADTYGEIILWDVSYKTNCMVNLTVCTVLNTQFYDPKSQTMWLRHLSI